tara:strand:+ start:7463 stop:22063 length:14601 start_codon:yes stop_codon:yes gene_type:complete
MALTRLDNLISSKTGKYLYVSPDDFNASDELNNRGNSPVRPFKSIQRAFLEIARFSYLPGGPDNDRFDQFTVMVMPGNHYIDNRPGFATTDGIDAFQFDQALAEWADNSNLDIKDPNNVLYKFNNTEGGAIIPRGSSIIGYDLRRTIVRPLYVPDPADPLEKRSAIFNVTGGCYFWQFTIKDGDLEPSSPLYSSSDGVGKVYSQTPADPSDWGSSQLTIPNFSHHKLTVFEYADKQELGLYYRKVAKAFSQFQPNIDDPNEFGARIQETRIVGPLSDIRSIESIRVDDISTEPTLAGSTTRVTVTTKVDHAYFKNQFVAIEDNGLDDEIDGTFAIDTIDETNGKVFSYLIEGSVTTLGSTTSLVSGTTYTVNSSPVALGQNANVKAEVDSVESASPYVFNCSIRSTWGICGIWANGLKATGFKSMVIAQYTGVSLQKDDRAFIRYDEFTNTFNQASLKDAFATTPYHTKGDAFFKDDWRNFHVRASEDSFIQCVSIFAVGFADHFLMESGGDMSITNSNSNFGNTSLHAIGHKGFAFNQDKGGYIDAIIPPKKVLEVGNTKRQSYYTIDIQASNDQANHTKIYLGDDNAYVPTERPAATIGGYRIGAKSDEKLYVKLAPRTTGGNSEFNATLSPNGFKRFVAAPDILNPSSAQVNNKAQDAANLIEANKEFIAFEAYGFITAKYPALLVKQSIEIVKCRRDIGYLLDATIQDLRLGGNINTIQAAESYYVKSGGVDNLTYINNELNETLEGYFYARDLAIAALRNYTYKRIGVETTAGNSIIKVGDSSGIAPGMTVADYAPSEFENAQGVQTNDLKNGATRPAQPVIPDNTFVKRIVDATTVELGQRATTSVKQVVADRNGDARNLILANKTFIATEAYERMLLDYPNYTPSTGYNATTGRAKCIDDIEKAIEAVSENTAYGGNADTWDAAYYYDSGAVQDLAAKKDETITAFNYAKDMSIQVMRKENVFIFGTHGLTQSYTTANDPVTYEEPELVNDRNGDARNLILANKQLIAKEAVERMILESSTQQFTPSGAVYNPVSGDLTLTISQHGLTGADSYTVSDASYEPVSGKLTITIANHGFGNGERVKFDDNSLTFTCSQDSNATQHTYPRASDPVSNKWLKISHVTANTFEVNVGDTLDGNYTHTFVSAVANGLKRAADSVRFDYNSFIFTCDMDASEQKKYPRIGDPAGGKVLPIGATTADTITLAIGKSLNINHDVTTADYDPNTGDLTLDIGSHNLSVGTSIKIPNNSLSFKCALDNFQATKTYPRAGVDPYADKAIKITKVGSSFHTATDATYDPTSGNLDITIPNHGFVAGNRIRISDDALTFTCAMDNYATEHSYPRSGDPASGEFLDISNVTTNTFRVNVGPAGAAQEFTPTDATYDAASGELTLTIAGHGLSVGKGIVIDDNALSFTCTMDGNDSPKTYPRANKDNASSRSLPIISKTTDTITINVGNAGDNKFFTPSDGTYNAATGALTLNIGQHGLAVGSSITLKDNSIRFTCDKDGNTNVESYPRPQVDPFAGKSIEITDVAYSEQTATDATYNPHSGDLEITVASHGFTGPQEFTPLVSALTTYDPATGILTLNIPNHGLQNGEYVRIADGAISFTCTKDNDTQAYAYPRATDPASGKNLVVSNAQQSTFDVNVGVATGLGQYVHTVTSVVTGGVTSGGDYIQIADNSLSFTCDLDANAGAKPYPRTGFDLPSGRWLQIRAVTANTFVVNVGKSSNLSTHTFDSAVANGIRKQTGNITINVGFDSNTNNQYTHTWDSALTNAVEFLPQSAHTFVSAVANSIKYTPNAAHTFKRGATGGIARQNGTITVNVGPSAPADRYAHIWAGGTATGAVVSGGNYTHAWVSSVANSVHKVFSIAGNRNYHDQDCVDDTVDVLEAIADNVAYGGNDKTWDAAYSYKTGAHVAGEEIETNEVFRHAKEMAGQVIKNQKILQVGGSGISQVFDTTITEDTPTAVDNKSGDAYNLLIANAAFIASEAYDRMIFEFPDFTPPTGNPQDCKDDIKDFVVEIAHNVGFGGNDRVLDMANLYVLGAYVVGEEAQTLKAFEDAKELMLQVARNEKVLVSGSHGKTQTFDNTITTDPSIPSTVESGNAKNLILDNKNFIAEIALGRMLAQYSNYVSPQGYTTNDCLDDLKDVVEVVAHNVAFGGNDRTWDAALLYNAGAHAAGTENETIYAFNQVRDIIRQVIVNETVTVGGHTALNQATNASIAAGIANGDYDSAKDTATTLVGILTNAINTPSSLYQITRTESTSKCTGVVSTITTLYTIIKDAITTPESLLSITRTVSGGKCDNIKSTIDTLFGIITSTVSNGSALDSVSRNISNGSCQEVASTITTLFSILTNTISTTGYLDTIDKVEIPLGLSLGQSVNANSTTTDTYLWITWPSSGGVPDTGIYTDKKPVIDAFFNNDPANAANQDTNYPECANEATAVRQYFTNIATIIQSGLGTVTRNEPVSSSALSRRATIFTLTDPSKAPANQSDPHKLETGTPVRLVPRPKSGATVDKRNVRLPNGFDTNEEYYVIAPGRETNPQDFAATTAFNGLQQDVLMLASSKENAAAGIYLHSQEVGGIHPDIEIDLYQFTIDDSYDLHQYACTLVNNGIQTDVSHIFDLPKPNVPEGHPVFFRAEIGKDMPTVGGTDANDPAVTVQSGVDIGKLRGDKEFFARYITPKVFKIYRTHADAINDVNAIDLTTSANIGFNVFANKRTSPMRFDPSFVNPQVSDKGKWYLQVEPNSSGAPATSQEILARLHDTEYNDASGNTKSNDTWYIRLKDDRTPNDRIYRFRYVIPSYLKSVRDPLNGFTLKMRKDETRKLLPQKIVLKPASGNAVTKAIFNNTTDSGQANEIIGMTAAQFANPGNNQPALDTSKRYDPFRKDLTGAGKEFQAYIRTDSKIQATIQSGRYFVDATSGDELLELTVFDPEIDSQVPALKNETLTTVKITAPQGGTFISNTANPATGYFQDTKVEWDGNDKGTGYIHAALNVPGTSEWHLILKGISGTLDYSSTEDTRFTQVQTNTVVFADQLADPDDGKSLALKELIRKGYPEFYYKEKSSNVYTLTAGDSITDQAGNQYYIASVNDIGEIDDTFYIFDVEEIQRRIFEQQDGIFYLTAVRGNISPFPTGAGNLGNFRNFKFSQPISKLFPLNYKNDPVWFKQLDPNLVDPPATFSAADNYVHGLVTVNDFKNSITKEAVIDFLQTPSLNLNTYTGDNAIQAQDGNAASGSEDRQIPIAGDNTVVVDQRLYVELRRPSIARAGNHTFEYLGFGPGNYSTGLPARQEVILTVEQDFFAQSKKQDGGLVFYTGLNSNGDLYIGNRKIDAITGEEVFLESASLQDSEDPDDIIDSLVTTFDTPVTFNQNITVNGGDEGKLVNTFNSPVTVNVASGLGLTSFRVLSTVNPNATPVGDDETLDRSSQQGNTLTNGDIVLNKNMIAASVFQFNPRGSNGFAQGYKIQNHVVGTEGSNATPSQSATGKDYFDSTQVVRYGTNGALPVPGDILLKGDSVGASGSIGWIYANSYYTLGDQTASNPDQVFNVEFDGSSLVKINWKNSKQNGSFAPKITPATKIRIKNCSEPALNGVHSIDPNTYNETNSYVKIIIGASIVSSPIVWNSEVNASMEYSDTAWKEWGVLGGEAIRTETSELTNYKVGINTVARTGGVGSTAWKTSFVNDASTPKANLDVDGNGIITGYNIVYSTGTFVGLENAFLVGTMTPGLPNSSAIFRVNAQTNRVGINVSDDQTAATQLDRTLTVNGTGRFSGDVKFEQDIDVNGGGAGVNNTAEIRTSITDGTFEFLMNNGFEGQHDAYQTSVGGSNGFKMAGYAKNIEFGNEQTLIQEFEIGNKAAKSFVDLGATSDGDGTNAHISRVSIGGAFDSTETDSYAQINNKELKIAGDILLGQVKDKTNGSNITRRGAGDTAFFRSTAETVSFLGDNSLTTIVDFATNASQLTIAGQGGTTKIRNNTVIDSTLRVNSDIILCGGLNNFSFTADRKQAGSASIIAHTNGIIGNNIYNKNVDIIDVLRIAATVPSGNKSDYNRIDTGGSGAWGDSTWSQAIPQANLPALPTGQYYLPLKYSPYNNINVANPDGDQYFNENDILLIDSAETATGHAEFVKIVSLPRIVASNSPYYIVVSRQPFGTFTNVSSTHADTTDIFKCTVQLDSTWITSDIDQSAGNKTINLSQFGGNIDVGDYVIISRADGTPANDGVDDEGEIFKLTTVINAVAKKLSVKKGCDTANETTVFEVDSITGSVTIGDGSEDTNTIINGSLSLKGLCGSPLEIYPPADPSLNDKFTLSNSETSVFSVDMCNGDTIIGHTVGTVFAIGQYYGSTAIAHDSTTVVTSYMHDPVSIQSNGPITSLANAVTTSTFDIPIASNADAFEKGDLVAIIDGTSNIEIILITDDPTTDAQGNAILPTIYNAAYPAGQYPNGGRGQEDTSVGGYNGQTWNAGATVVKLKKFTETTSLIDPIAATGRTAVESPNQDANKIRVRIKNSNLISDKLDYIQFLKFKTGNDFEWFYPDSIDGNADLTFGVRLSKSTRLDANGNFLASGTHSRFFGGGALKIHDHVEMIGGNLRMYGSDGETLVFNVSNDDDHIGDGAVLDEATGVFGMYVNGGAMIGGDLKVIYENCQTNGTCSKDIQFQAFGFDGSVNMGAKLYIKGQVSSGGNSQEAIVHVDNLGSAGNATTGPRDLKIYQDCSIDAFGISRYFTRNGGRRYTYVEQSLTGIGQTQANPLQPNNNYLINTSSGNNVVMYLPEYAETGDMIRFVEVSGNLTYNTSLVLRALKVNNVPTAIQGDTTGTKIQAGAGQLVTAWDSGELVVQTRNASFGLIYVGATDAAGDPNASTVPSNLRGWWLTEL